MAIKTNPAPSSAALGTPNGSGSRSTTKAGVLGYILGLATAGILYVVTQGKGKRSNESGSACPMPEGEPTPLPSTAFPVDDDVHDVNDGCTAEVPENLHAPAGQRKLTDEDVETIRAMKDAERKYDKGDRQAGHVESRHRTDLAVRRQARKGDRDPLRCFAQDHLRASQEEQ